MGRTLQSQYKIMIEYMERYNDLNNIPSSNELQRLEKIQKWYELVSILNATPGGEPKSLAKWKKIWSDWKTNTKKKVVKLKKGTCTKKAFALTILEKRLLKLMSANNQPNSNNTEDIKETEIKVDIEISKELSNEALLPPEPYFEMNKEVKMPPEPYFEMNKESSNEAKLLCEPYFQINKESPNDSVLPPPPYFEMNKESSNEAIPLRPDTYFESLNYNYMPSSRKYASSSDCLKSPVQSPDQDRYDINDEVREITDQFFEYEREKNRRVHEQKMASIKQNEQLLSMLDRMVNVVETVAPSVQKYLERETDCNR